MVTLNTAKMAMLVKRKRKIRFTGLGLGLGSRLDSDLDSVTRKTTPDSHAEEKSGSGNGPWLPGVYPLRHLAGNLETRRMDFCIARKPRNLQYKFPYCEKRRKLAIGLPLLQVRARNFGLAARQMREDAERRQDGGVGGGEGEESLHGTNVSIGKKHFSGDEQETFCVPHRFSSATWSGRHSTFPDFFP